MHVSVRQMSLTAAARQTFACVAILLWVSLNAASALAESDPESRYLRGLRERRLFTLAELEGIISHLK